MNTISKIEMLELVDLLFDIIKDDKANRVAKFSIEELRLAYIEHEEYEIANFSKYTQDFINEVKANEAQANEVRS